MATSGGTGDGQEPKRGLTRAELRLFARLMFGLTSGPRRKPLKYSALDPRAVHYLRDLKRRGADAATLEAARWRRWRMKNGLEHRAIVALVHAPEVIPWARRQVSPADFLTPAYAALAAVLLEAEPGSAELARARAAIAGRAYLPDPESNDWPDNARALVGELAKRRERWTAEQLEARRCPVPERQQVARAY